MGIFVEYTSWAPIYEKMRKSIKRTPKRIGTDVKVLFSKKSRSLIS